MPANYVFLPWLRQGAASSIQTADGGAQQAGVVSVAVKLRINDMVDIQRPVRLHGPGDVTGIDPQQVVRTEPRHLATAFEPNYFPAIDFDRPDFPWLFTPAKADADGHLRSWLCLVVIQMQAGVALRAERHLPLPVLDIKPPAVPGSELPDLSESWAWAHAQIAGSENSPEALRKALGGDPALTVSRLLCPRRLDPATDYLACVVPAFDPGRKAGLGQPITQEDEAALKPAWTSGDQAPVSVSLPVYHHWTFRTAGGGDFEALVRLLQPRPLPRGVGRRPLDISRPGFRIDLQPADTVLEMEGALRAPGTAPAPWPEDSRKPFQAALKTILDAPWRAFKEGGEPLLAPPIYGGWLAARQHVDLLPAAPDAAPWLDALNLDPRHRATAALGTRVVQTRQEQLMASAWDQLGDIQRINQARRQGQLGQAVNGAYHEKHFSRFSGESLLQVVAPARSRVLVETAAAGAEKTQALLSQALSVSALPARAVSAPVRRLASPRGAVGTRFRAAGGRPDVALMARFNDTAAVSSPRQQTGLATLDGVSAVAGGAGLVALETVRFGHIAAALDTAPAMKDFTIAAEGTVRNLLDFAPGADSADAAAFRQAAKSLQTYVSHRVLRTIWQEFRFVLSGDGDIVYGVDPVGRLVFHREDDQGAAVHTVIGLGGWQGYRFLSHGGNGILYAVDAPGRLLFYRDPSRDGSGDVGNARVIGLGGWQFFRFVFAGGDGILYAVDDAGRLLFYRDATQDGTGDVANPRVIGQGWQHYRFAFAAGGGVLYAVDQAGRLLFFRDLSRDGNAAVSEPKVIGSGWQDFRFVFAGDDGRIFGVDALGRLLSARDEHRDGTGNVVAPPTPGMRQTRAPALDLPATRTALLRSIDPARTIRNRVQASFGVTGAGTRSDDLEPILDQPEFPQPMYEALRDLSQDFLLPGLERVPDNTVTLLETNRPFVEAFLVGLNTEMSRELLWRGYPTDQRGTGFRRFWDTAGGNDEPDIEPIARWGNKGLGDNLRAGEQLVLLIRGELLRSYPNAVIYAVRAVKTGESLDLSPDPADEMRPVFRGTLIPDVTFLGFALNRSEASADPGWFFVIQEQPTEPRFGLDAADFGKPPPDLDTWNDLSWRHLAGSEDELKRLTHAPVKAALPQIGQARWGRNAAHQAYVTLQRPVRIAIHAKEMIPQD